MSNKDFMKLHKYDPKQDYSGWLLQQKFDGVFAAIQRSTGKVFSRTGKEFFIPQDSDLYKSLQRIVVQSIATYEHDYIIAEVTASDLTLEQLSGLLNPNRKQDWTWQEKQANWFWHLHDHIILDDGTDNRPYFMRLNGLRYLTCCAHFKLVQTWNLADAPQEAKSDIDNISDLLIKGGAEGVVLKDPLGVYQKGKRSKQQLKLVREHTEDVRIVAAEYGKGKREKQLARWQCQSLDNPDMLFWADLGAGWDDEARDAMTYAYEQDPATVIGTVWVVKGLQKSSTGKAVRLPKLQYRRFDKGNL